MVDPNTALFLAIYDRFGSPVANVLFTAITYGGHLLFWAAVGLVLVLRGKKRPAVDLLTSALIVILAVQALKWALAVPRPFEVVPGVVPLATDPLAGEADPSFPSGHTALAAAGAVILSSASQRLRAPLVLLVLLVALSRIYLGLHYPADVLAGALLGAFVGWTAVEWKSDNRLVDRALARFALRRGARASSRNRPMAVIFSHE